MRSPDFGIVAGLAVFVLLYASLPYMSILPGIIIGTRTQNEPVTAGERTFIIASTKKALEDGYIPVKVQNFVSKKKERA